MSLHLGRGHARVTSWSPATPHVSDLAVAKVHRFCDQRLPAEARAEVRLEVTTRAATITIVERRPLWQGGPGAWTGMPIAQTSLRHRRGHLVPVLGRPQPTLAPLRPPRPNPQLDDLLKEIDEDPSPFSGIVPLPLGLRLAISCSAARRCLQTPSIRVAIARFGSILCVHGGRGP
jgi:hypothetical protein